MIDWCLWIFYAVLAFVIWVWIKALEASEQADWACEQIRRDEEERELKK